MNVSDRFIPIAKPLVGSPERDASARAIASGWLSQGQEVSRFEEEFAAFVGAQHSCAVSSCTAALHLALLAVGVSDGNEVVTVSHSFIASANAIRYCGAIPVFIDVKGDTFNLDPTLLEEVITSQTRAILCVHQLGMPCDMTGILEVAREHGLPVIEDAACAVGSEILEGDEWERIGKPHGDIACFSFHPRKVITTGDGGMLVTNERRWDRQFRLGRQHSMSVPDTARHEARRVIYESYQGLGFNYRMTDIQGAIGREQLRRLPEILIKRRSLARRYRECLENISGLECPKEPPWARSNWQSFCVRLPERCDQRWVMQYMLDESIATRRGVMSIHREAAYPSETWSCGVERQKCGCAPHHCLRLRNSERIQDHAIILPLFPQMTAEEVERVVRVLGRAVGASG